MARPKVPLLSRERITSAAIKLIDQNGLGALSLPALAAELRVSAPSLYHHFHDKAEILAEVARAIAISAPAPKIADYDGDWIEWMVDLSNSFRRTVLKHRNAAPIFVEFLPRELLIGTYDRSATIMEQAGVPAGLHVLILDGCDKLSLGAILMEAGEGPPNRAHTYTGFDADTHARLARAVEAYELSADELFKQSVRAYIRGVLLLAEDGSVGPRPAARSARTKAVGRTASRTGTKAGTRTATKTGTKAGTRRTAPAAARGTRAGV
jgi:AcrR family transcriptional regulator